MNKKYIIVFAIFTILLFTFASCATQGHRSELIVVSKYDKHETTIDFGLRINYSYYGTFAVYNDLVFYTKTDVEIEELKNGIERSSQLLTKIFSVNNDKQKSLLIWDETGDIKYPYIIFELGQSTMDRGFFRVKQNVRQFRFHDLRTRVVDKNYDFYKTIFFPLYSVSYNNVFPDRVNDPKIDSLGDWEFTRAYVEMERDYRLFLSFEDVKSFYQSLGVYEITETEDSIILDNDIQIKFIVKNDGTYITVSKYE